MKFAHIGTLIGMSGIGVIEATRQITLRTMEGEGSAIWTCLTHMVIGFPLSLVASPVLESLHEALEAIPGPVGYVLMLLLTLFNWIALGLLADRWVTAGRGKIFPQRKSDERVDADDA